MAPEGTESGDDEPPDIAGHSTDTPTRIADPTGLCGGSASDRKLLECPVGQRYVRYGTTEGRWVIVAVVLASAMVFLDGTVVNVALPAIDEDLDAGVSGLQWIVDGYLLTLGASSSLVARSATAWGGGGCSAPGWLPSPPPRCCAPSPPTPAR